MGRIVNKSGGSWGGQSFGFIVFPERGCTFLFGPRLFSMGGFMPLCPFLSVE